jgi:hypothetical protein
MGKKQATMAGRPAALCAVPVHVHMRTTSGHGICTYISGYYFVNMDYIGPTRQFEQCGMIR